ncbi:response regulator transcription factor [Fulvimarina sp. MAC3]|uniref:helix-turn-helix transcriptional regulator n=1 Tax=Fulvimarina sp. MAC3 TaxID=3148887 RepID=UPI0031FC5BAE
MLPLHVAERRGSVRPVPSMSPEESRFDSATRTQYVLLSEPSLFPWCYRDALAALNRDIRFGSLPSDDLEADRTVIQNALIVLDGTNSWDVLDRAKSIQDRFPKATIILATEGVPSAEAMAAFFSQSCVKSILPMDVRLDLWLAAMSAILEGLDYVPLRFLQFSVDSREEQRPDRSARREASDGLYGDERFGEDALRDLTHRELEVLAILSEGRPNKIIAEKLGVSEHTVKLHIHKIMRKLKVSNRTEAASYFIATSGTT